MKTTPSIPFGTDLPPSINRDTKEGIWLSSEEKSLAPSQWGLVAINHYKAISKASSILPSGAYEITKDEQDNKPIFIKKKLIHDNLIPLSGIPEGISKEIKEFWAKEEKFSSLGFLHRRGYLLYGSHGTGKSSLVHAIVDSLIAEGGVVFYCENPDLFNIGLILFRQVEPNRKIVCVFEDIDAMTKKYGEHVILSILDGENLVDGVCNLATTNYPELLDKRIVGRPRRFDRVFKIGNLDDKAREAFLSKKLPKGQNIKQWVKKTQGLSIASISEVIISVFCFGRDIDAAVGIVESLTHDKSSEEYRTGKFGFGEVDS